MEGMIQRIAQECADVLGTDVTVEANLQLVPMQQMKVKVVQEMNHV
jgi:hypothetical protein